VTGGHSITRYTRIFRRDTGRLYPPAPWLCLSQAGGLWGLVHVSESPDAVFSRPRGGAG